jgi:hypothetical protein
MSRAALNKKPSRKTFPYLKVAKLWTEGKTIAQIATAIRRIDKGRDDGDRYHSLRNFLRRMHIGYPNEHGVITKLPYRISRSTLRRSKIAKQSNPQ